MNPLTLTIVASFAVAAACLDESVLIFLQNGGDACHMASCLLEIEQLKVGDNYKERIKVKTNHVICNSKKALYSNDLYITCTMLIEYRRIRNARTLPQTHFGCEVFFVGLRFLLELITDITRKFTQRRNI